MLSEMYDMTTIINYVTCDWVVGNIFKSIVFLYERKQNAKGNCFCHDMYLGIRLTWQ